MKNKFKLGFLKTAKLLNKSELRQGDALPASNEPTLATAPIPNQNPTVSVQGANDIVGTMASQFDYTSSENKQNRHILRDVIQQ